MEHVDHQGQTHRVTYEAMGDCTRAHNSFHV
nr:hypothetical protein [Pseudomonas sp. PDM24]